MLVGDDDVEARGVAHQQRGHRSRRAARRGDVREVPRHLAHLAQEQALGDLQHVRLVHRGHLPAPRARQLRTPRARCGASLARVILRTDSATSGVGMNSPMPEVHVAVGVEALGVLAHDDEIHRRAPECGSAGARARGPDVRVEVELDAQLARRVDAALLARRIVEVRDRPEHDAVGARGRPRARRPGNVVPSARSGWRGRSHAPRSAGRAPRRRSTASSTATRGRGDLGSDPVAGQDDDPHRGAYSALTPASLTSFA